MKIEWLMVNVTTVGIPVRAEVKFFGLFLIFLPIQVAFVVERHFVIYKPQFEP